MENIWMFLQQTAAASLVALFLLILQRIFLDKLSPRWQYGVWLVLLLRLLVPAGFGGRPTVLDVTFWVETLRTRVELGLHSAYSTPFTASLPAAPVPLPPAGAPASWTDWAFLIYCAGAVLWAAWFVVSAVRLSLRVRGGVPVEGERRAAMEALAKQQRLPMPRRIVECRWARTPFVVGVVRPALVLPMGWALDEKVVLHELLHLKYRDVWAGWLTTALRCLHWCNPFLWFVFDKTGNDRESLCDQRVLERLEGEDRRDYGRCLLAMADDKAVRTPGATTMANGARAVKARIEAIARFKRFPQGMGLVSGCIVFALSLSLVAGVPVSAAGTDDTVETPDGGNPAILALAAQNRATTVAGALDAYGKALYHWYQRPGTGLLCAAMVTAPEDMPAVLAANAKVNEERVEDWSLLEHWWQTGPVFRGLTADGGDGYLCQVFWFRDVELASKNDPLWPEEGEPWPTEYLCHTVHVQPDGGYWTVEKLAETSGLCEKGLEESPLNQHSSAPLYGPITWSGEANGVSVELSHTTCLLNTREVLGLDSLHDYFDRSSSFNWSGLVTGSRQEEGTDPEDPVPNAQFFRYEKSLRVQVGNPGGTPYNIQIRVEPDWHDPEIVPSGSSGGRSYSTLSYGTGTYQNHATFYYFDTIPLLKQGETNTASAGSGGGSGGLGADMKEVAGPDFYTVTVQKGAGESFQIPLTPRYTTPDGGTFPLDGEEATP